MTRLLTLCVILLLVFDVLPRAQTNTMIGDQGNLWNNANTDLGLASNSFDTRGFPMCVMFGTASIASMVTLQVSANNIDFYGGDYVVPVNGAFGFTVGVGARFIRLSTNASGFYTATVQCKLG